MAYTFDSTADGITFGTTALPLTGSIALWFKPTWAQNDGVSHFLFDTNAGVNTQAFSILKFSDNSLYLGFLNTTDYRVVVTNANYTITQNAWNHIAVTFDDTANVTRSYLNGTLIGTPTSTLVSVTTTNDKMIGNSTTGQVHANAACDLAEFSVWNAVLTADEVAALARGFAAVLVRPTALVDYLPLVREMNNVRGAAGAPTSVVVAPHCRIIYQRHGQHSQVPVAATVQFAPTIVAASTVVLPLRQYLTPTISSSSALRVHVTTGTPGALPAIQPDGSAGFDAVANHAAATTNNGTSTAMGLGGRDSTDPSYAHVRLDLTGVSASAEPYSVTLSVYTSNTATADRDYEAWISDPANAGALEAQLTWNERSTGVAWAGGANGGGVENVDLLPLIAGTAHYTANDPTDTEIRFRLYPEAISPYFGSILPLVLKRVGVTTATSPAFRSSDSSIGGSRPKLVIEVISTTVSFAPTIVSSSTLTADLSTPALLASTISSTSTLTAVVTTPALLAPTMTSASVLTVAIVSTPLLAPTIAGTSTLAISLSSTPFLSVTIAGASTLAVSVSTTPLLTAVIAGTSTLAVALSSVPQVAPTINAASSLAVSLSSTPYLTVTIVAASIVDCSLGGPAMLAPTIVSASALTVTLTTPARLVVSIASSSILTVDLSSTPRLTPTIAATSTLSISLSAAQPVAFVVTIAGSSTLSIALSAPTRVDLGVTIAASSALDVTLTAPTAVALVVSIAGTSTLTVDLLVPTIVIFSVNIHGSSDLDVILLVPAAVALVVVIDATSTLVIEITRFSQRVIEITGSVGTTFSLHGSVASTLLLGSEPDDLLLGSEPSSDLLGSDRELVLIGKE